MPEVKNTFLKSKMNKDLDARILPNGEYRDAQNVNISKSEGDDVGSLENVLSNIQISNIKNDIIQAEIDYSNANPLVTVPPTKDEVGFSLNNLEIIGKHVDIKNNRIFLMLTNYIDTSSDRLSNFAPIDKYESISGWEIGFVYKGAGCYIYMLDLNAANSLVLLGGNFLNFSKTHKILSINTLESLLFWTDDRNQPRKINVDRAINEPFSSGSPYYYNEDHISVAKFAPVLPISLIEETSSNNWSSTMQSVTEEWLPAHLVDVLKVEGENDEPFFRLNRRFDADMLKTGDRITLRDPDTGDEFINIVTSVDQSTGAAPFRGGACEKNWEDVGVPGNTKIGWVAKFQRRNPLFDENYIGDENVLRDKFQRFSYRFKYDDNEYSLFAPFTQEVFVPKQYGYFIDNDEDKTGKAGVVEFMENLIDKVKFNIRLPFTGGQMQDKLKIKEIQIVSKASNEQAVRVIENVLIEDIEENFNSIQDYIYEYNSIKPYKVLPENDLTRVHDQVPIKAKCQEITSNRVMYGNFVNKHASPDSLDYQLSISAKKPVNSTSGIAFTQLRKEYPNHTLKQNRSYTVGVVLMDRYGRSSNVILSKQKIDPTDFPSDKVSTIYSPYSDNGNDSVLDWPGNALEIQFNKKITNQKSNGQPGLYSLTNPLGWYSYKIVVKQQEQEYYNVYVPGIVAGEILWNNNPIEWINPFAISDQNQRNATLSKYQSENFQQKIGKNQPTFINSSSKSLISLFGDNINKLPRNLNDSASTDIDFGSSITIFNRVNPNTWISDIDYIVEQTPPFYDKRIGGVPLNTQGEPIRIPDTIDFIKPFKQLGNWANTKGNLYPGSPGAAGTNIPGEALDGTNVINVDRPLIDPWYTYIGHVNPINNTTSVYAPNTNRVDFTFVDPLYKASENVYVASITTSKKTGVNPQRVLAEDSTAIGQYLNSGSGRLGDITLGVYETSPVESVLEIFWETSTSGLIETDSYISSSSQYIGLNNALGDIATDPQPAELSDFSVDYYESKNIGDNITNEINILDANGSSISSSSTNTPELSIDSVYYTPTGSNTNITVTDVFELYQSTTVAPGPVGWKIRLGINHFGYYSYDSNVINNYTVVFKAESGGQIENFSKNIALTNIGPKKSGIWPPAQTASRSTSQPAFNPASQDWIWDMKLIPGVDSQNTLVIPNFVWNEDFENGSNISGAKNRDIRCTVDFVSENDPWQSDEFDSLTSSQWNDSFYLEYGGNISLGGTDITLYLTKDKTVHNLVKALQPSVINAVKLGKFKIKVFDACEDPSNSNINNGFLVEYDFFMRIYYV